MIYEDKFSIVRLPTDIGIVLRGGRIPGVYLVLFAELGNLLVSHGDRYIALVCQKNDRYIRPIRQRDLFPEIVQPLFHRLKGRPARNVKYESRCHSMLMQVRSMNKKSVINSKFSIDRSRDIIVLVLSRQSVLLEIKAHTNYSLIIIKYLI